MLVLVKRKNAGLGIASNPYWLNYDQGKEKTLLVYTPWKLLVSETKAANIGVFVIEVSV